MKKTSSKRWLQEHFSDVYVKRARQEGFRARSVYKLKEINQRYHIIKPGMVVVDLGAAPGGWSEYAVKIVGHKGSVYALDLLPMQPIAGVKFIQGDFTERTILDYFMQSLSGKKVDVVLSDMAPNLSGIKECDQARSIDLAERALHFADLALQNKGTFLVKIFQGAGFNEFLQMLRKGFKEVKTVKPDASRARSRELFLLAQK